MSNVIDIWEWKRARLGTKLHRPMGRRARQSRREGGGDGFVRIGELSQLIVEKLRE